MKMLLHIVIVQEASADQPGLLVCGFSPDGSHIVAGSNDCHIYAWFWDIAAAADKGKAAAKQGFYNVFSQQDAARNLEPPAAVELEASDWPEPQEVCRLGGHVNDVLLLQFSHDGQSIATGSKDGTMRVNLMFWSLHLCTALKGSLRAERAGVVIIFRPVFYVLWRPRHANAGSQAAIQTAASRYTQCVTASMYNTPSHHLHMYNADWCKHCMLLLT